MRSYTFLEYKRYRYLKISSVLLALVLIAYVLHQPATGAYGGTWLGYVLGSLGLLIILILLWFGMRKRQYSAKSDNLLGWLSAHVYLGASLIVIATLHTGFQFGWNVHTLAFVLMMIVILSGFYGVYAYVRFPKMLTQVMGEETLDTLFLKITDSDQEARRVALAMPDEINQWVMNAAQHTRIGGSFWQQLHGRQANCPTDAAVIKLHAQGGSQSGEQAKLNRELYFIMLRKQAMVKRARENVAIHARLAIWLYFHVPVALAMLAALAAHIFSVFYYW
jgi:hypothetical protein